MIEEGDSNLFVFSKKRRPLPSWHHYQHRVQD